VRGADLVLVEDMDPNALPAASGGSDGNHSDVRGAPSGHAVWSWLRPRISTLDVPPPPKHM